MLRWLVFDVETNEELGTYATLKEAFSEGNMYRLKTGHQYFIEDRLSDEELSWTDTVWSKD